MQSVQEFIARTPPRALLRHPLTRSNALPVKPIPNEPDITPGMRSYLHLTILLTGASILVIEILGARMLTPFFGSSHFVWSAQIAITMLALAAGYALGGVIADRRPGPTSLYSLILLAAGYLVATVAFRIRLATACLSLDLALGSILASFALFFVPLSLLATAGPLVVRMLTTGLQSIGGSVGRLSALGTVGSLAGVIITSYLLIPWVRDSHAMIGTALTLALVSLGYFIRTGINKGPGIIGASAMALLGAISTPGALKRDRVPIWPGYSEIARTNSHFGLMQVIASSDQRRRYYLNDFLIQNSYDASQKRSLSLFTELLAGLSDAYTPATKRALCIGMGVGIVPMRLARSGIQVDVVEINPAVVPLAQAYFDFDPSKVNLAIDDARHFLAITHSRYDTIHLDAFIGDSMPSHLMTREAFQAIKDHLEPDGTLVINSFVSFVPGRDFLGTSLHRTLRAVFKEVAIHASDTGNVFYVASDRTPLTPVRTPGFQEAHDARYSQVRATYANRITVTPELGLVLTDDFNPADFRDATNREELRKRLAQSVVGL